MAILAVVPDLAGLLRHITQDRQRLRARQMTRPGASTLRGRLFCGVKHALLGIQCRLQCLRKKENVHFIISKVSSTSFPGHDPWESTTNRVRMKCNSDKTSSALPAQHRSLGSAGRVSNTSEQDAHLRRALLSIPQFYQFPEASRRRCICRWLRAPVFTFHSNPQYICRPLQMACFRIEMLCYQKPPKTWKFNQNVLGPRAKKCFSMHMLIAKNDQIHISLLL